MGLTRPSLVNKVSHDLRQAILSGEIAVGEKLPTEAHLTQQYSVSRTVVREAIAALRADGLIASRQGAGVFVIDREKPATSPIHDFEAEKISSIIEVLELRAAVEMEAAALAAVRRSPAQDEAIQEMCDEIDQLMRAGESTVTADFKLHLTIADATNNPRFRAFLELMGEKIIPRTSVQQEHKGPGHNTYLAQIQAEHRSIAIAISERNDIAARDAMRAHLLGSQQRYRALLRKNSP